MFDSGREKRPSIKKVLAQITSKGFIPLNSFLKLKLMKVSHLITVFLLFFSVPLLAQKGKVINGRVTGQGTEGLAGVTVTESNTNNSVTSDASGNYSIKLTHDKSSLVFSYVGFTNR